MKDASATAIYGSRASNGVIIITTKKGTQDKIKVSYSGTFTAKDPYKRIETMDAASFRQTIAQQYPTGTTVGDAAATLVGQYPEQSTNWQDEIFQTGLSTDHNIGVAGKVGFLPFRVSLGYNTEKGTLKTSDYDRYTASVNFSPKFFDKHLSVDINVKGTINKTRFADREAVAAAAFFDPTKPVYNETGRYNGYWSWENAVASDTQTEYFHNTLSAVNPLAMLNERDNHGKTLRSLGNIQLDYKFHGLEDLHANLNLGYDVAKATGSNFVNAGSPMAAKDTDFKNVGQGNTWNNLRRNHLLDFYLNYAKDIEAIQSHFDIMAGYSWQHFYYSNHYITSSNLIEKGVKEGWEYSDEEGRYVKNGHRAIPNENYLVSFFGRLNYSFKNRYLLTATLRRDGSSRFSKNNRWGTFPSAAFAWTVLNEPWMKPVQLYSPIMPTFQQVVQNAGAGEFTWSLHGRVGETNLYSKTSRYLLAKMETYGAHPADITESISGCLGGNYYFKSQYVVFDNDIYYIVSAMYADPFGWHTEGIWLFYGGLAVVFLIIIATILTAFISCRRTFSQMEDAERKETVITALAHDVKSPLMAISGYAENLKQLNQTGESQHYIDVILENTSYMNELLCQLSEYIKLGKMEALQTVPVNIEQIWEPLQERYQNLLEEKDLEVRMLGSCTVKGDPLMISYMLENLFVNAIKYSLKGSVIRLVLKEDHLILSNQMEQPLTTDPEELWKPFVKGDEARTGRSGSGIGLSIV